MVMEVAKLEPSRIEDKAPSVLTHEDESKCVFYKHENCNPDKINFKMCAKCHRCRAITFETALPAMFNRIVALAGLLMSVFGVSAAGNAAAGNGTGTGAGAGSGSGGSGGAGGSGGGGGGN